MKILLVGEYSRLHNSLKEGLHRLGHEVTIVGTGDDFKKFNVDYSIFPKTILNSWFLSKLKNAVYRFTNLDAERLEKAFRFYRLLPKLKGYDHVQLINSNALETNPLLSKWLYKKLLRQNKQASLLICGDETPIVEFYLQKTLKYSILTPLLENPALKNHYAYTLKYITPPYKKLFEWLHANVSLLITSDLDYRIPMQKMGFKNHFIPNPINIKKLEYCQPNVDGKVILFLGINRHSYIKKGLKYFEEALEIVKQKHPDKVEIIVTENVPYIEYIKCYQKAHILLDQVYAYDQGYNALEAMAAGKVVFTGAEIEFNEHYKLTEKVAINAVPNAQAIADELMYLIENPNEIKAIAERARAFIEEEHHYIKIAERYLEVWKLSKEKFPEPNYKH